MVPFVHAARLYLLMLLFWILENWLILKYMIISSINSSRANYVYGMDTIFFKTYTEALFPPISKIVNWSINDGVFPRAWKTAIIHKCLNQVITWLVSIIDQLVSCRIFFSEQIRSHLNSTPFSLHPMQFGFRKSFYKTENHSTETANCFLLENIKSKWTKEVWWELSI